MLFPFLVILISKPFPIQKELHETPIILSNSATYNTHLVCQPDTIVEECPKWRSWTAIWSSDRNKVMRKHQQDINGFLPRGHGLSSRAMVMAPPLWQQPFTLTSHSPLQSTFIHIGHVAPLANTPHIFHNSTLRPLMAKLTEDFIVSWSSTCFGPQASIFRRHYTSRFWCELRAL
jgi:hypothetical protein